jgi:dynein intermediate chain 1
MPPKKAKGKKQPEPEPEKVEETTEQNPERVRPEGQLDLDDKELEKEHNRVLTANNPNAPDNILRFSNKAAERQWKLDANVDQTAMHFVMDGTLLHRDTDEAKRITANAEAAAEAAQKRADEEAEAQIAGVALGEDDKGEDDEKAKNQFNFSDRACQTFNNPMRERTTETEPPPSVIFSANVTQWEIFDLYTSDLEKQKAAAAQKARPAPGLGKGGKDDHDDEPDVVVTKKKDEGYREETHPPGMIHAFKILERMVNQNTYDEISMDYTFWEDKSDAFKESEGSLLPLWKFYTEKAKRKHVTAITWSPQYNDMFAVSYGSYDFMHQTTGLVCVWSLKNPSYPEFIFQTESGAMCLDFHPVHSALLVVGLYDGTVLVYDVRVQSNKPIYSSSVLTGKHRDPVWQVSWQIVPGTMDLNFFSISSDGKVLIWTMSKNELQSSLVMCLQLQGLPQTDSEDTLSGLAGGICFDFNQKRNTDFIIGTEEGMIHKCSTAYTNQYLESYSGHSMAVYAVKWNVFHPGIFISSSADWSVKVWDQETPTALMTFDMGNSVGDVCWSPYSATVFAAATADGKVHVFDLNENKHEAMCEQKVVKKAKLTHVSFNPTQPMLIVGDDRGCINSLKLSPNLRKTCEKEMEAQRRREAAEAKAAAGDAPPPPPKKDEPAADGKAAEEVKVVVKTPAMMEVEKLEKILHAAENAQSVG